jgi:hypothetical protein
MYSNVLSVYITTPPEASGVGTYSNSYPGISVLKLSWVECVIFVSVTPITLK